MSNEYEGQFMTLEKEQEKKVHYIDVSKCSLDEIEQLLKQLKESFDKKKGNYV